MPRVTWRRRASGALLALLVQGLFLLLVVLTPAHKVMQTIEKETLLLLPPLAPPLPPTTIDARPPSTLSTAPPIVTPPPDAPPPVLTAPLTPPGGITGFGRSLFGCAPENYAQLTPDERARCPKPGEGMAKRNDGDLLNPPKSHAKDEDIWQEQWAEDHYVPPVCPLGNGPGDVAKCVMHQDMAENHRAADARSRIEERRARERAPRPPSVPNIGVRRN